MDGECLACDSGNRLSPGWKCDVCGRLNSAVKDKRIQAVYRQDARGAPYFRHPRCTCWDEPGTTECPVCSLIQKPIKEEKSSEGLKTAINPEWLALEGKPHLVPVCCLPDQFKSINIPGNEEQA